MRNSGKHLTSPKVEEYLFGIQAWKSVREVYLNEWRHNVRIRHLFRLVYVCVYCVLPATSPVRCTLDGIGFNPWSRCWSRACCSASRISLLFFFILRATESASTASPYCWRPTNAFPLRKWPLTNLGAEDEWVVGTSIHPQRVCVCLCVCRVRV